jgi:hypothetical protein
MFKLPLTGLADLVTDDPYRWLLVDDCDYPWAGQLRWRVHVHSRPRWVVEPESRSKLVYARTCIGGHYLLPTVLTGLATSHGHDLLTTLVRQPEEFLSWLERNPPERYTTINHFRLDCRRANIVRVGATPGAIHLPEFAPPPPPDDTPEPLPPPDDTTLMDIFKDLKPKETE